MYNQTIEGIIYLMFYASVAMLALIACCYLLFRRSNAIAPSVTPPVRLRRFTAAFFAVVALCHMWYLPMYFLTSPDEVMHGYLIAGMLDSLTVIPLMIVILFTMLQDRRRPLWPVAVMIAPLIVGLTWCVASRSDDLLLIIFVYFLLMSLGFVIYMVRAIRQYGRWLRDNYADLEHKEVWQGFVVLAIYFLVSAIYSLDVGDLILEYAMEVIIIILVCYLLWRVETLSDLSLSLQPESLPVDSDIPAKRESGVSQKASTANINQLLQKYCIDTQLYLQHDLSLSQLAQTIGTNRTYLTNYFVQQGITYNAYINNLRINHFINLYREAAATQRPVTAQQLAHESGYRSYSTFTLAFKQRMGKNVTTWISDLSNN